MFEKKGFAVLHETNNVFGERLSQQQYLYLMVLVKRDAFQSSLATRPEASKAGETTFDAADGGRDYRRARGADHGRGVANGNQ
jgi:hypothetical protein